MDEKRAPADAKIALLAARHHGIVTFAELRAAGIGRGAIEARVKRGALHRLHQGVYAVGHESPGDKGRWMAAVLAVGNGAVLSHANAAALWGFLRPPKGPVDVSLPGRAGRRRRDGIRIHRPRQLPPRDWTIRAEIRATTPRRTIHDLWATEPAYLVRYAARQAQHRGFNVTLDRTRSDLERDFTTFCRHHRLPPPEINVRIDVSADKWFTADFLWPAHRLVVETDSYQHHQGDVSFEDDHARDLALRRQGFTVLRYTGRQLEGEVTAVAAEIRSFVDQEPANAPPAESVNPPARGKM